MPAESYHSRESEKIAWHGFLCNIKPKGKHKMYINSQDFLNAQHFLERSSRGRIQLPLGYTAGLSSQTPKLQTGQLTPIQVLHAVTQNQMLGQRLGWTVLYDAIASWILNFQNLTPAAHTFARAVANWQLGKGLSANGILDVNTWRAMLADAKAGMPRPFQTPEGIARPHGLGAIVRTFGDPTQRGWEARSIVTITAPAGRQFMPRRTRLRVHRLLAPHLTRLFIAIHNAGLWNEIFPSAGTFVCRTKHSYGKHECGTPGIRFDQLSTHSWGITIDIRASDYKYFEAADQRLGKPLRYPPPSITKIFQAHGFHWGLWFMKGNPDKRGRIDFTNADPMHFQFATGY